MLNSYNNKDQKLGFSIVELLVIVIIIGILVIVGFVAYNGLANGPKVAKTNTDKAQSNAQIVQGVIALISSQNESYPYAVGNTTGGIMGGSATAKVPKAIAVIADASTTTINASNGLTTVAYSCLTVCDPTTTGGRIAYWDFSSSSVKYVYVGAGSASDTWAYPTY